MQVTPAAARSMGVGDVGKLDNNVRASVKYLADLRRTFFASPRLNDSERMAFVLAAYNVGPQRVQSLRAEARRRSVRPSRPFHRAARGASKVHRSRA